RRPLQTERGGELPQRRVGFSAIREPPDALLLEGVARVALRKLGEMALLPALRDEEANRAAATLRRERGELLGVRHGDGNDDLRRQRRRHGVVLPQER